MRRPFTAQEVERDSQGNRVSITRGEFNKAALEEPLLPALIPEPCGATPDNDVFCFYANGHNGRCSWKV